MSDDEITNTVKLDKLQPVTADGLPIKYNDNNATMPGILFEVFAYWKRNGLFQEYIAHHAAPLNNGRLAVDSVNSIPFILGTYKDARTAGTICPPTPTRMREYNSKKTASEPEAVDYTATDKGTLYVVAPHEIAKEDNRMLQSLSYVIAGTYSCESWLEEANGSGTSLHDIMKAEGEQADPLDIAVVCAEFDRIKTNGIQGELTLTSLKGYHKEYKTAKLHVSPEHRPQPELELQMMNNIGLADPDIGTLYESRLDTAKPKNMADAIKLIEKILTGRKRTKDLQQARNGGLAAEAARETERKALLARVDELEAQVANGFDPKKDKKPPKKKPEWVKAPRDKDGNLTGWIKGMKPCKCKKKQPGDETAGGHLSRDCTTFPKPPTDKPADKEEPPKPAAAVTFEEGESDEVIAKKVAAHFAAMHAYEASMGMCGSADE